MMAMLGVLAIVLTGATQSPQTSVTTEGTGKISGVVTHSDTDQPLRNATV